MHALQASYYVRRVDKDTYDTTNYTVQVTGLPPDAGVHEVGQLFAGEVVDAAVAGADHHLDEQSDHYHLDEQSDHYHLDEQSDHYHLDEQSDHYHGHGHARHTQTRSASSSRASARSWTCRWCWT